MNRRSARRYMALTSGGLLLLPACGTLHFLYSRQEQLLTHIVDTIIPATDTLGAKDLNVPTFVQKVLTDCYEQEVQEAFLRGLDTVERISRQDHGKSFSALKPPQRLELLTQMGQADEEEQQAFVQEKPFTWTRGYHVGGKSLMWARQTQRWSDLILRAPPATVSPWTGLSAPPILPPGTATSRNSPAYRATATGCPSCRTGSFCPPLS